MDEPLATVYDESIALDYIRLWARSVELQYGRASLEQDSLANEADVAMFVVAVRSWMQALAWYGTHHEEAAKALTGFTERHPGVIDARHAFAHFDEFNQGELRAQRQGRMVGRGIYWETSGNDVHLNVAGVWVRFAATWIDVKEITAAMATLGSGHA